MCYIGKDSAVQLVKHTIALRNQPRGGATTCLQTAATTRLLSATSVLLFGVSKGRMTDDRRWIPERAKKRKSALTLQLGVREKGRARREGQMQQALRRATSLCPVHHQPHHYIYQAHQAMSSAASVAVAEILNASPIAKAIVIAKPGDQNLTLSLPLLGRQCNPNRWDLLTAIILNIALMWRYMHEFRPRGEPLGKTLARLRANATPKPSSEFC